MKIQVSLLLVTLGCVGIAFAGEAEDKAARELTQLVLTKQTHQQMLSQVTASFGALTPQKQAQLVQALNEALPYEEMVAFNAEVYARHFSTAELKQLIAFYKTPVGRKLALKLPDISGEAGKKTAEIITQKLPAVMEKHGLK